MMCVVCALTPEQDSTDAFGDSWRGPYQPGTAVHKSIASAKSIAIYFFYFAITLLLGWLIDVVLSLLLIHVFILIKRKK